MSDVSAQVQSMSSSPFEAIRRTRLDGSEYWSARDLMPLLGYDQWRRFADAIERAKTSAQAQGYGLEGFLPAPAKTSEAGGRPREDFHLSRFACYLVAMNGDPRKSEVAAAQAYFAIRTREAETATPALTGPALMAAALIEAQKTLQAAEQRAVKAENVVAAITDGGGITLTQFHKHYFPDVPERVFFEHLYTKGILIDQRGKGKWDEKRRRFREGNEHRHPSAKGKPYLYLEGHADAKGRRREYAKVRPGSREVELAELLASQGLPAALPSIPTTPVIY